MENKVMKKLDSWKQSTPIDQFTVIRTAMEWEIEATRYIDNAKRAVEYFALLHSYIIELKMLEPFLRQGKW